MSHPFSQTVRSLNADGYRGTLIALSIALVLMTLWGVWFFYAPISIYRTSREVRFVGEETETLSFSDRGWLLNPRPIHALGRALSARFSASDAGDIRAGQRAVVRAEKGGGEAFPAVVETVRPGDGVAKIRLRMERREARPKAFPPDGRLRVDIEISRLTPAELALRAYEKRMEGGDR